MNGDNFVIDQRQTSWGAGTLYRTWWSVGSDIDAKVSSYTTVRLHGSSIHDMCYISDWNCHSAPDYYAVVQSLLSESTRTCLDMRAWRGKVTISDNVSGKRDQFEEKKCSRFISTSLHALECPIKQLTETNFLYRKMPEQGISLARKSGDLQYFLHVQRVHEFK